MELGKVRQDTGFHNDRIERASLLPLRRTELPNGTIELARFLIGKAPIRELGHAPFGQKDGHSFLKRDG
jgi:hypothetical protein